MREEKGDWGEGKGLPATQATWFAEIVKSNVIKLHAPEA